MPAKPLPPANRTLTTLTLTSGTPIYLVAQPCTACGCHQLFAFECNCGTAHGDVCYNCMGFTDVPHNPIEVQNQALDTWWAGRCTAGQHEHTHTHPFKRA